MACNTTLSLSLKEDDTPLDQAIYSSAQNKIYGVRGKWLYRFNATTGVKEAAMRFNDYAFSPTSICEFGSYLYIATTVVASDLLQQPPGTNATMRPDRDVFKIDTAAFSLVGALGLGDSVLGTLPGYDRSYFYGFRNLLKVGSYIVGWGSDIGTFKFDPTNIPGGDYYSTFPNQSNVITDIAYDPDKSCLWVADSYSRDVWVTLLDFSDREPWTPDVIATTPAPRGLTFYPGATPKVYAVNGTNQVVKVDADVAYATLPGFLNNPTWSSLFILEAAAKPIKIKYQPNGSAPYPGKIFIPTWANDTVEILDPTSDTIVSIKTGFSDPIDVVFTPTKAFAVQNSGQGLKEIT